MIIGVIGIIFILNCLGWYLITKDHNKISSKEMIGYIKICNNLGRKMEFDKSRVYTAVNADELKVGDKVICANDMGHLKHYVTSNGAVLELQSILDENNRSRFIAGTGKVLFHLVYLVERKENCTNCERLGKTCNSLEDDKITCCFDYKPKTEQKYCTDCKYVGWASSELCSKKHKIGDANNCIDYKNVAEKHYRRFQDTDELIKVWEDKNGFYPSHLSNGTKMSMSYIWVRKKINFSGLKGELITRFDDSYVDVNGRTVCLDVLFTEYEFLDGSPCGVEE